MKKYPLDLTEEQRRKTVRHLRISAIMEWFLMIPFMGMGYILSRMIWDSDLIAIAGAVAMLGFSLLLIFAIPVWRRVHLDTWRLLQQGFRRGKK